MGAPGHSTMVALVDLPTPSQVGKCVLRLSLMLEKTDYNKSSSNRCDIISPSPSEDVFDAETVVRQVTISNEWIVHVLGR